MPIKTNPVQLTPDDVRLINRASRPFYAKHIGKIWIGVFVLASLLYFANGKFKTGLEAIFSYFVLSLIVIVLRKLEVWFNLFKLRRMGAFDSSITYEIDEEFIGRQDNRGNSSRTPWKESRKLITTASFYLLYQRRIIDWIPVDAFKSQEDIDAFEEIIFALDVPMKFYD